MVMVMLMIVMIMVMILAFIVIMVMITRVTLRRLRRCSCGALATVCRARLRRQLLDVRKICLIFVPCLISETRYQGWRDEKEELHELDYGMH